MTQDDPGGTFLSISQVVSRGGDLRVLAKRDTNDPNRRTNSDTCTGSARGVHFLQEPGPGQAPVTSDRLGRYVQDLCCFLDTQPAKKRSSTIFPSARHLGIRGQSVVQGNQVNVAAPQRAVPVHPIPAGPFPLAVSGSAGCEQSRREFAASAGADREEMRPVLQSTGLDRSEVAKKSHGSRQWSQDVDRASHDACSGEQDGEARRRREAPIVSECRLIPSAPGSPATD